jgi:hypothetical protein
VVIVLPERGRTWLADGARQGIYSPQSTGGFVSPRPTSLRGSFCGAAFLVTWSAVDLSKPLRAHYFDMVRGLVLEIQEGLKMHSLNMFNI